MDPVFSRAYNEAIVILQYAALNPIATVKALLPFTLVFIGVLIFLWLADNITKAITTPSLKIPTTPS